MLCGFLKEPHSWQLWKSHWDPVKTSSLLYFKISNLKTLHSWEDPLASFQNLPLSWSHSEIGVALCLSPIFFFWPFRLPNISLGMSSTFRNPWLSDQIYKLLSWVEISLFNNNMAIFFCHILLWVIKRKIIKMRIDVGPIWSSLELDVKTDEFRFNRVLFFTDKLSLVQLSKPCEKSTQAHLALSLRIWSGSNLLSINFICQELKICLSGLKQREQPLS